MTRYTVRWFNSGVDLGTSDYAFDTASDATRHALIELERTARLSYYPHDTTYTVEELPAVHIIVYGPDNATDEEGNEAIQNRDYHTRRCHRCGREETAYWTIYTPGAPRYCKHCVTVTHDTEKE